jgi:hypothetical protein
MGTPLLDKDPFAEIQGGDSWLSPDEDEIVLEVPQIEAKLAEMAKEQT